MRVLSGTCLVLVLSSAALGEHVDLLDSRRVEGRVISVTDKHVTVNAGGQDVKIDLRDVAEIKLCDWPDIMAKAGRHVLCTSGGDMLAVSDLTVSEGSVSFATPTLGEVRLPVAAAEVLYQPPSKETPEQLRQKCLEMKLTASSADMLVVAKEDGSWLTVTGLLKAVGQSTITFSWKDTDRQVSRETVRVIFFGKVNQKLPPRAGVLVGSDGSTMGFESVRLQEDSAVVRIADVGERKVPRDKLAAIRFESQRVVGLADLKPVEVKEYGVFKTFPHRVNRSVGGGPIHLGGRTYDTGLGLHSFCQLSYELNGQYATFVGVAGIDDSARPGGDAVLTFLGDGKELAKPLRLTGGDAPETVRLNVSRVRTLTVRVDFGEHGLDSGDHVDLAAARVIK
jgi:hypothetical protein